ncbi:MAG: heme lyase CcmF/NrfE family subunit [Actinobacteria bacterium]|nr:heme lyase CcmF/NrfE family subunit [Actinomycetota bacterium]MBI3686552.1 heme lyase CcmF/NrfE family subunit [Actinomycetota bacterium]
MTSLVGLGALAGGCGFTVVATVLWALAGRGRPVATTARLSTWGALACALVVVATMEWALITHDFSVRYVASNGGRAVPVYYTVISLWAALEGSLLLWLLVLTGYAVVLAHVVHPKARELHPWAMATVMSVAAFFFALALATGNAFDRVSPVPADGPGPNPLLQDHPLMGVHPPLLYLGYVGLTVPFGYAVAALITGQTGRGWLVVTRRWMLLAWSALTVGILLGAWWSYEVLGWGGYWAWDPVENASILPWFTATALLHSIMVQERRSILSAWNLSLAMATFLLVLVGTFLTRSGVVASVHAFTQSALGPVLLGYLAVVAVAAAALLIWRADRLGPSERIGAVYSRESVFLANNVLFVALAVTVLVGTVFPLLVEAVTGDRASVGPPFFNRLAVPLALGVVLLMAVGPLVPWASGDPRALARRVRVPAVLGFATVAGLGLAGLTGPLTLIAFGLAAFALGNIVLDLGAFGRLVLARRRRSGGLIVHAGMVVAVVAIAASSTYAASAERAVRVGEQVQVGSYTATLVGVDRARTPRYMSVTARLALRDAGQDLGVYTPALRFYPTMSQAIGSPSVHTGLTADAYLTVSSVTADGNAATVRLTVTPMMFWLWASGAIVVSGALLAGWPGRRRTTVRRPDAPAPTPEPDALAEPVAAAGSG